MSERPQGERRQWIARQLWLLVAVLFAIAAGVRLADGGSGWVVFVAAAGCAVAVYATETKRSRDRT